MRGFQASKLVPLGFVVDNVAIDADRFVILIRASAPTCRCPLCGAICGRVHSRHERNLADFPAANAFSEMALKLSPGGSIIPFCEPATVTSTPHSS